MKNHILRLALTILIVSAINICSVFSTIFIVTNTNNLGAGSLRDAMTQANFSLGHDTITFNIASSVGSVSTIYPLSALPMLTDNAGVTIDGFSQGIASAGLNPPATAVLTIEVNGAQAGLVYGFHIISSNNIIQGLVVDSFARDGIRIEGMPPPGTSNNLIYCCFVGTDPAGTLDYGNGWNTAGGLWAGINILVGPCASPYLCFSNTVDGCLSSGNFAEGVSITNCPPGDCYNNTVEFCYLGIDITGMFDLGNDHDGVLIGEGARDNLVKDNLISGNDYEGVTIIGYVSGNLHIYTYGNTVQSNVIGLASDGITSIPNTRDGVSIGVYGPPGTFSHQGHAIDNLIFQNTIARNGSNGVMVWEHSSNTINADGNKISENHIHHNTLLGIDLNSDGQSPNDPGDPDVGANQTLNYPTILNAYECNGMVIVKGLVDIPGNPSSATIEIYLAQKDDAIGYGEGCIYIVTGSPDATGAFSILASGLTVFDTLTAIIIDSLGNTSEFSQNMPVDSGLYITETHIDASCFGVADGSIDITVTHGLMPYTYLWSNSATTEDIISIGAGTYKQIVTDGNNCKDSITVIITEPPALLAASVITHPSSAGASDGSIDLTVSGGTPGYNYLWTNGATTQDISGLIAGTYSVTITDAAGCQTTYSDTLVDKVSVEEIKPFGSIFSLFPNPVNHILNVESEVVHQSDISIRILNIDGKLLMEEIIPAGLIKTRITVVNLAPGIYYAVLQIDNGDLVFKRFVKR